MRGFHVEEAFVSAVSVMEIRFGIQRVQAHDQSFAHELSRWLNDVVLKEFAGRILPFDLVAGIRAGGLPTADKRLSADAMIAATALENGLQVVTRNVAHFEVLGADCLNPWLHEQTLR